MSDKYNLLPGASHFLPFSWGSNKHLHYSYTKEKMFCKQKQYAGDEVFEYVEVRDLDEDEYEQLDAMSASDYVGPGRIFSKLPAENREASEQLDELVNSYRTCVIEHEELQQTFKQTDLGPDDHANAESSLEFLSENIAEAEHEIRTIIQELNRQSGYDPETGKIRGCDS